MSSIAHAKLWTQLTIAHSLNAQITELQPTGQYKRHRPENTLQYKQVELCELVESNHIELFHTN